MRAEVFPYLKVLEVPVVWSYEISDADIQE